MELSDLQVFRTVAEEGGISAAAGKLHRVPSNITARIQKLEQELGTPLFVRERNRLRISGAGSQLLAYADKILDLADQAMSELQDTEPGGTLSVSSMESVAATRLAGWLSDYHHCYPRVLLKVQTGPTGKLIQEVINGDIDIGLVADPPRDSRLISTPIIKETLVMVSHKHHRAIRQPGDLEGPPTLLGFNPQCAYRQRLEQWLAQEEHAVRVVEIGSYHTLLSCAAAGMGVGLVTRSLLDSFPDNDSLKVHRLPTRWSRSETCLIHRADNHRTAVTAFKNLAKQINKPR